MYCAGSSFNSFRVNDTNRSRDWAEQADTEKVIKAYKLDFDWKPAAAAAEKAGLRNEKYNLSCSHLISSYSS